MQDGDISPLKAFFRNKLVRIVLIIDALAILIVLGIIIYNATKVSTINFNITPVDSTISVNGNTDFTNGIYKITPGSYKIKISHEGLESKTFDINIAPKHDVTITTFLKGADNNFEFYELKVNYESYQKLTEIASAENNITTDNDTSAEEFIAESKHKTLFLEILPIKGYIYAESGVNASTAGFAIRDGGSHASCEKSPCLLVNYYGTDYKEAVEQKIKEAGYTPSDYQIIYEEYK